MKITAAPVGLRRAYSWLYHKSLSILKIQNPSPLKSSTKNFSVRATNSKSMMEKKNNQHESQHNNNSIESNPRVSELQKVIHSDNNASDSWDKSWRQGITPWDLGQATPIILHLHRTGALPKGTALVPGCGTGYDVVAMACPERYVYGLEISENAIKKATEFSASSPNADYFTFMKADFFTWSPPRLFDLIFDYTFFCAIEPLMRTAWAQKTCQLLKPGGELITLMFPISDHVGGPPYKVSVSDYEEVLHPVGFEAISIVDNEMAIGPRKGKEKLGRWKLSVKQSSL